jgi:enoyl-CoA hydratase
MADYTQFQHLLIEQKDDGVLLITINRPAVLNATNARLHWELANVWKVVGEDPKVRVVVITGAGRAFSVGGDNDMINSFAGNFDVLANILTEASDIVYNIANLDKPIISAINGYAMGAGLAAALMADISIIAEDAKISDGHLRIGVVAGDHSLLIWPLLCGMAKAKLYLLTGDFVDGREAERIGLVSMAVPRDQVLPKAIELASRLGRGPQIALRWTKRALNNWLRVASPMFDHSIALEMLTFMSSDAKEGIHAVLDKREPKYPSTL